MSDRYQLRVIVTPSESSLNGKPKKFLFEKYIFVPLEDVKFSSIIDVLQQFFPESIDITFQYDNIKTV